MEHPLEILRHHESNSKGHSGCAPVSTTAQVWQRGPFVNMPDRNEYNLCCRTALMVSAEFACQGLDGLHCPRLGPRDGAG